MGNVTGNMDNMSMNSFENGRQRALNDLGPKLQRLGNAEPRTKMSMYKTARLKGNPDNAVVGLRDYDPETQTYLIWKAARPADKKLEGQRFPASDLDRFVL